MSFNQRFATIRGHVAKHRHCDFKELEREIGELESEVLELLNRTPDGRPARVTVTAR